MSEAPLLEARLAALVAQGAAVFDGPGVRFISGLLSRSAGLSATAQARLMDRARSRLGALEARFEAAQGAAEAQVAALAVAGADPDGAFAACLAQGDFRTIERQAPGALRAAQAQAPAADLARLTRLTAEARRRGVPLHPLSDAADAPGDPPDPRAAGDALAQRLFKAAADQARAALVVARAADAVPAHHGPYNAEALAAEGLAHLERLSPAYLRVWLASLEGLSALSALPERPKGAGRRRR